MKTNYNKKRMTKWNFSAVTWFSPLLIGGALLASLSALAVPENTLAVLQTANTSIYSANFFAQYNPRNALEMVERLPGFSYDKGSSVRGFGANAGNVLINGQRPTAKSGGVEGALIRLPAEQVVRIEILRGGANASEAAGQSMVANIISSKTKTSGTWAIRSRQTQGVQIEHNLEAALSTQLGQWQTSFDADIGVEPDYRTATIEERDQDNDLSAGAAENYPTSRRFAFANGEGAREVAGGQLTLNGHLGAENWSGDTSQNISAQPLPGNLAFDGDPDTFARLNETNKTRSAELGIDWVFTNDDNWKLRLLGLGLVDDTHYSANYFQQKNLQQNPLPDPLQAPLPVNDDSLQTGYVQDRLKSEVVARATYGKIGSSVFKPEFGFEVANNRLDTDAVSFVQDNPFARVDGSAVVVEEWRGEAFANFAYEFNPTLTFEGGITSEFSQIKVSGDANQQQSFQFVKPRLAANYQFNDDIRLTFEAHHQVGQLSFNHFAANSVAAEKRITAGNPDLTPDQISEITTTFDWSFSERGSFKLKLARQWREDILEQVVLSTDEQGGLNKGLGNAGKASTFVVTSELKLPLDAVLHNGLIDIMWRTRHSSFDDPIIGDSRSISNYATDWLRVDFRQDLTKQQVAWGIDYFGSFKYNRFLVDEIQTIRSNKVVTAFIETTRFFGVKIQLQVARLNNARRPFERQFYDQTRAGELTGSEIHRRTNRPEYMLSVFGTF